MLDQRANPIIITKLLGIVLLRSQVIFMVERPLIARENSRTKLERLTQNMQLPYTIYNIHVPPKDFFLFFSTVSLKPLHILEFFLTVALKILRSLKWKN